MKIQILIDEKSYLDFLEIDSKAWHFASKILFNYRSDSLVRMKFISLHGEI